MIRVTERSQYTQASKHGGRPRKPIVTAILIGAIAKLLTDRGVPASDIVLGFHSPFKRQFSGYALA
jgi:XisI protein